MAKSKKGNGAKKPGPAKKGKAKAESENAAVGHNIRISKKAMADYAMRFNRLMDDKEDEAEKYKADVDALAEEGADALGVSKADFRKALKEQRAEKRRMAKEAEMDPERLQNLDKMRDALGLFGDLPLGQAAIAAAEKKETEAKSATA